MLTADQINTGEQNLPARPRLGLALSGGGACGLAHIGVLKELERAHIPIDYLAGTSMGGVIAAVYAAGMGPAKIEAIAMEFAESRNILKLVDRTAPRRGLFQGEQLHAFFRQHLRELTFAELRIPLTLVAVDLNSGQEVHFHEGRVADAVRASVSVPGLLAPVESNGQCLVDGGLLNNLPADVVRQMGANLVLAVDVANGNDSAFWQSLGKKRFILGTVGGLIGVLGESLELIMRAQRTYKLSEARPDFLLQPPIPQGISLMTGYHRAAELVSLGEESTRSIVPQLQAALQMKAGSLH